MTQEEHSQKSLHQAQCGTRNLERTDVQEETSAETGMQQGHKEPICRSAATSKEREENCKQYQRMEQKTAVMTGKERI
jgi:hypothetical protein